MTFNQYHKRVRQDNASYLFRSQTELPFGGVCECTTKTSFHHEAEWLNTNGLGWFFFRQSSHGEKKKLFTYATKEAFWAKKSYACVSVSFVCFAPKMNVHSMLAAVCLLLWNSIISEPKRFRGGRMTAGYVQTRFRFSFDTVFPTTLSADSRAVHNNSTKSHNYQFFWQASRRECKSTAILKAPRKH